MLPVAASLVSSNIKPILITVGVVGGGYLAYRLYQNSVRDGAQNKLDQLEAQQANTLLSILHPFSYKGLSLNPFENLDLVRDKLANVDEAAAILLSKQIKDFNKVSSFYSGLTGGRLNLVDDIRGMLDTKEQSSFFENVNISKYTSQSDIKEPVYLYSNPGANFKNNLLPTYSDGFLSKPILQYPRGAYMGKASKLITVPFKAKNGTITPVKIYLFTIEANMKGLKGKFAYVLASAVTTKNK